MNDVRPDGSLGAVKDSEKGVARIGQPQTQVRQAGAERAEPA